VKCVRGLATSFALHYTINILKKKVKFVLTCATEFGTIYKSAIGRILPYLRDIAMNREIAQVSEVTFGEYVRTSGG
jgi:hypothetical protein